MSRLNELKKEYPELNISFFDLLVRMDPTKSYKYLALLCKLFSQRFDVDIEYPFSSKEERSKMILEIHSTLISRGISTNGLSEPEIITIYRLADFWNHDVYTTIGDFIYYNEHNKISNKDVTSYSHISELRSSVSLAVMKELDREMENQVIKEHEDDKWVVVRPLTFQASIKYGASTRWCTTYQKEKQYFERYWRQGVLVYFINKQTGYKFAGFKSVEDRDLSFWNAEDQRIDFLSVEIDDYLFPIVKRIFSSDKTNKNLSSNEIQEQVHKECLPDVKEEIILVQPENTPYHREVMERIAGEVAEYFNDEPNETLVQAAREYNQIVETETGTPVIPIRRMNATIEPH